MWARCKAPYQIQAPTTTQKKGQGLSSKCAVKARGRLFSKLRIVCPNVGTFEAVLNRFTKETLGHKGSEADSPRPSPG